MPYIGTGIWCTPLARSKYTAPNRIEANNYNNTITARILTNHVYLVRGKKETCICTVCAATHSLPLLLYRTYTWNGRTNERTDGTGHTRTSNTFASSSSFHLISKLYIPFRSPIDFVDMTSATFISFLMAFLALCRIVCRVWNGDRIHGRMKLSHAYAF